MLRSFRGIDENRRPMNQSVRAAIFDLDGLLLDTERLYDEIFRDYIILRTGAPMEENAFLAMRAQMFGASPLVNANRLHALLGIHEPGESFLAWRKPRLTEMLPRARLLPGAESLVRSLARKKVPMAIATSSDRGFYTLKTGSHREFFSLFGNHIVTSDDVYNAKPEPDLFLMAAAHLSIPPRSCLVFEDAPNGVEAALRAGMRVVAVPHPQLDRSLVARAGEVLDTLEQFDPARWNLFSQNASV